MSATLTINIKPWADQIRRLDKRMATKTYPQLFRQQGKLFVQDLQLATPPFDKSTINGPLNAQRKIGEKAVERDVKRLFRPLPKADTITQGDKREARTMRTYVRLSKWKELSTILNRLGVRNSQVIPEATEAIHNKHRNEKGRIPKKINPIIVVKSRSISVLVRTLKGHVGKLKAGWNKAALHFRASVPNWILKHSTPGGVFDLSKDKDNPSITVSNASEFGPKVEWKIVQFALKKREGAMRRQLEKLVKEATATL